MVHLEDEPNAGKAWTPTEIDALKRLASQQIPTRDIADRLGRSEYSVRAKASHEHIQLRSAKRFKQPRHPR